MSKNQLEKLLEKEKIIKAKILNIKAKERKEYEKKLTRKKILVGACFIEKFTKENKLDDLKKIMDVYLKRNNDRILFDLEPIKDKEQ